MKHFLLFSFVAICSLTVTQAQVFMTELADPLDATGARYVELFNAGETAVNLADPEAKYALLRYTNGNAEPQKTYYYLTGTIPSKGVFVVAKSAATFTSKYGVAPDLEIPNNDTPLDSNGDDQIVLLVVTETDTITVDIFGVPGEDGTGTCHGFEDGRAERATGVTSGNGGNWSSENWNVWGVTAATGCTNHINQSVSTTDGLFDPGVWIGYTPSNTIVTFESTLSTIDENGTSVDVCVTIENPSPSVATTVDVVIKDTTLVNSLQAVNGTDYASITSPYKLTFPAGSSVKQCITFTIIDDTEIEIPETIVLELANVTGGTSATIGTRASHIVQIADNDLVCLGVGALIISEVMQNSKTVNDPPGEWFEIYNTTDADIDLFGIKFRDDITLNEFFIVDRSLIIKSKDYAVFAYNGDPATNGGVMADYGYPIVANYTLANSTDGIVIECNGVIIDSIKWDNGATFPNPNGASMYLLYDKYNSVDNDNGANWAVSTTPYGDGDFGTPGTGEGGSGVNEYNDFSSCKIYPNPATDFISISSEISISRIDIYSYSGALIKQQNVSGNKAVINISDLNAGIYFVQVKDALGAKMERIVKQ